LCPADDENPDLCRERMFFTRANGERIDAIREQIATWETDGRLSPGERAYLLAPLLYAVSYASNTSGVFKGFHRGWGGATGTALYRIRAPLRFGPPILLDDDCGHMALCDDALSVARDIRTIAGGVPDIVYVDPPYNQHPYASNYHVLTTVTLWDKPPVEPVVSPGRGEKSAIRRDWREKRRSLFNSATEAAGAFERLLNVLDSDWILVSYSTDGNIPLERLLAIMAARGDLRVLTQRYRRYRVSTPRMSPKSHNVEFVALLNTRGRPCPARVDQLADGIRQHENESMLPA
jgi:adenine-specific DNA-methyltransferase